MEFLGWVRSVGAWMELRQQLTGAVIGFTGVILTLLWTSRQSRRIEVFRYEQQRTALAAAFYGELSAIQSIILEAVIYIGNENYFFEFSKKMELHLESNYIFQSFPKMTYEKNADKLGQLGPQLSREIVMAYSCVAEFEEIVKILTSPVPLDLRTRRIVGKDAAAAGYFLEKAHNSTSIAIAGLKKILPKDEQQNLIMLPPTTITDLLTKKLNP